ncbi:MAG: 50S ribosomal protein L3, partial [Phycisphaerales bacterium]|nr:50S ribosomal protein L3 [Phycisphaerales bacterium]
MSKTLLGRKVGMSRYFLEDGTNIPVTIVEVGPCVVTQVKTEEVEGYNAIQMGYEDVKVGRATMPIIGHDAKAGTAPKRFHREARVDEVGDVEAGQTLDVSLFEDVMFVDVVGTSK